MGAEAVGRIGFQDTAVEAEATQLASIHALPNTSKLGRVELLSVQTNMKEIGAPFAMFLELVEVLLLMSRLATCSWLSFITPLDTRVKF